MTGYSAGNVRNLHADFFRGGIKIFTPGQPGGRKAAYITPEEEVDFLHLFIDQSDSGGILEVSRIHKIHCEHVSKKVALSTTYGLLYRHGWQKIRG